MAIFDRHIPLLNTKNQGMSESLIAALGIDPQSVSRDKLNEITYFTCLKILSESLGKLPLKLYQETDKGIIKAKNHPAYNLTKTRPNPYMTAFNFWSTVEMNRNHYGNAFVFIDTDLRGKVRALYILPSNSVQIYVDNAGIISNDNALWYIYTANDGKHYKLSNDQVMHFKTSTTFDGITGLSVQNILKTSIENAQAGQVFINQQWTSGLAAGGFLQYTGDIGEAERKKLAEKFNEMATGLKNAGKIVPMPLGFSFQALNNKMVDSQFLELNKYNALQIAAALGIKPNHINDYSSSTYASSETQQQAFYIDTLMAIVTQYEQEITSKIFTKKELLNGFYAKFNIDALMRATFKERWEAYSMALNNGGMTPNEVRDKEELPWKHEGESLIANGNYKKLADIGQAKGGE